MKALNFTGAMARLKGLKRHGFTLVQPAREWMLGLLIGILLLVAGGVYAAMTFRDASMRVVDGGSMPVTEGVSSYREKEVRKTLEFYEARARQFESLRGSVTPAPVSEMQVTDSAPIDVETSGSVSGGVPVAE